MATTTREKEIYTATLVGSVTNFVLMAFKLVAGILGNSAAMIADAVHSISDFATDLVVLLFVRMSSKPEDKDHASGHGKYETLATAIIGVALIFVGIGIFWGGVVAIWDLCHGIMPPEPRRIALIAAVVSVVLKEALYHYTARVGRKNNSPAVMANAWHHRSDAISSVCTMLGIGGAILLGGSWRILDPIASIAVSLLIVQVGIGLVVPSVHELVEHSLPESIESRIIEIVENTDQVCDAHSLRTRRIGHVSAVDLHVRMDGNMSVYESHAITDKIESQLRDLLGVCILNIHVEPIK